MHTIQYLKAQLVSRHQHEGMVADYFRNNSRTHYSEKGFPIEHSIILAFMMECFFDPFSKRSALKSEWDACFRGEGTLFPSPTVHPDSGPHHQELQEHRWHHASFTVEIYRFDARSSRSSRRGLPTIENA